MTQNKIAWDNIYEEGLAYLEYPREPVVIAYHRFKHLLPENLNYLDYGFGSGNHCEFMISKVKNLYGIEISSKSVKIVEERLNKYDNFKKENLFLSNNNFIDELENKIDIIIAWNCLYYNSHEELLKTIQNLYRYLKKGGLLITSLPTPWGAFKKYTKEISHNTYRLTEHIEKQEGCILTIPKDEIDFENYFSDFKALDVGYEDKISYKIDDLHSHYYGVFQK